jgi:hypothetical protein
MRGTDHICAAHAICFQCFKQGAERTRARREAYAQRALPFDQALPDQPSLSVREIAHRQQMLAHLAQAARRA